MKVSVRFFAAPREVMGTNELVQELPGGATVQILRDTLLESYPDLSSFALKFALNRVYTPLDTELHDGDQVACIPPVAGG